MTPPRSYMQLEEAARAEADRCLARAEASVGQVGKREWLEAADVALQAAYDARRARYTTARRDGTA
jgi:hypothetical protein